MAKLEGLREWLLDRIDGGEEMRGEDGLISDFIRKLDALSSEMGTIPDAERKKVMEAQLAATVEPKGCPTPGACSAVAELADLKQRLLPQFQGRTQRAEHERDGMLEKLIVHQTTIANLHDVIDGMRSAPSATGEPVAWCVGYDDPRMGRIHSDPTMHKRQAEALAARQGLALVSLYAGSPPVEETVPVDHGYDRTASLNAGHYVCTCGGGRNRHYDASQRSPTTQEQPK